MLRPLMLGALRVYRLLLSPVAQALGIRCRYEPSCSTYSADAIRHHGGWFGGWMTLGRLCRCHPLGGSGFDPVPDTTSQAPVWAPWRAANWRTPDAPDNRS